MSKSVTVRRAWRPPQEFDEYKLVRAIGRGGMGSVYLAHDVRLDRLVAIKVIADLQPHSEAHRRFQIEARAAARLSHPNVVTVYRIGDFDGRSYIASEYIPGRSLDLVEKPMPWRHVADIGMSISQGLAAAHRAGVLHRDIKPANAILGDDGQVKLVDFGLAKLTQLTLPDIADPFAMTTNPYAESDQAHADPDSDTVGVVLDGSNPQADPDSDTVGVFEGDPASSSPGLYDAPQGTEEDIYGLETIAPPDSQPPPEPVEPPSKPRGKGRKKSPTDRFHTRPEDRMGTPYYMAPELWIGEPATVASDIYALGALLYELCAGVPPTKEVLASSQPTALLDRDLTPLREKTPEVDPRFASVVDRCLRRDAAERFESVDEVIEALETLTERRRSGVTFAPPESMERKSNLEDPGTGIGSAFIGRRREIREITEMLDGGARMVTVRGIGGTGKTRLSRELGLGLVDRRSQGGGGVWFCDLSEAHTVEGICAQVAQALQVPLTSGRRIDDSIEQLGNAIAGRDRVLLILDNFEQIVEHAPKTVGKWLKAAPLAQFLVTTREQLRLDEEEIYDLDPLGTPEAENETAETVLTSEAVQLFIDRAQRANKTYGLIEEDAAAVAAIVRRLDGIPLAIELAAARTGVLSPQKLLDRLDKRFKVLKGGKQVAHERQGTLRNAIDWSWDLLSDAERQVLAQCAVFRGGFFLEAAEEIIEVPDDSDDEVLDIIQELRDKSLLRAYRVPEIGELRFSMFESIREYAKERLAEFGNRPEIEAAHAEFYLEHCEEWADKAHGPEAVDALDHLGLELDNLLAVAARAKRDTSSEGAEQAVRAALAADKVLEVRGPYRTHLELLSSALDHPQAGSTDTALRARALHARGKARQLHGQWTEAEADYVLSMDVAQRSNDITTAAFATVDRASLLQEKGDLKGARELYERFETTLRDAPSKRLQAYATGNLGIIEDVSGHRTEATELYNRTIELWRAIGDERSQAIFTVNLGIVLSEVGEAGEARRLYAEALRTFEAVRERRFRAYVLDNLGHLELNAGNFHDAYRHWRTALTRAREVGDRRAEGVVLGEIGRLKFATGEAEAAQSKLAAAVERLNKLGEARYLAIFTAHLAAVLARSDDEQGAEARFTEADEMFSSLDDERLVELGSLLRGHLDLARARAAARRGDQTSATEHVQAADERCRRSNSSEADHSEYERLAVQSLADAVGEAQRRIARN